MKHLRFLLVWLLVACMSLAIGCTPVMSSNNDDEIKHLIGYYEQVEELNEWEALGLKNLEVDISSHKIVVEGEKNQATDYARLILGNLATNNQIKAQENIVALQKLQKEDGSFKLTDADTLNNTTWAIITLETARINSLENIISYNRNKAMSYLARNQLDDGSFNGSGWGADTDSTAQVIIALSHDKTLYAPHIDKALNYIEKTRTLPLEELVGSGGDWNSPSVESTATYIEALLAIGRPIDKPMIERLLTYQLPDGSFYPKWDSDKKSNAMTTYMVLNALTDYKNGVSKYHTKFVDFNGTIPDSGDSNEPTPKPGNNSGNNLGTSIITPAETLPIYTEIILNIRTPEKYIIKPVTVKYTGQKTAYNLLLEVLDHSNIQYKARLGYVSEIDGLKERQSGFPMSGWLYLINGEVASQGANSFSPTNGDKIEWVFTLDGGKDITSTPNNLEEKLLIEEIKMDEIDKIELSAQPSKIGKVKLISELKSYFKDTELVAWAKEAIEVLAGNKIIYGTDKGFEPNRSITRAELIALLLRIQEKPLVKGDTPFSDINEDAWYSNVISTAVTNGLVAGSPGSSFNPNQPATRNDLAFYLTRADKVILTDDKAPPYKDYALIPSWAKSPITYVSNKGYLKGYPDGNFHGTRPVTRAEAAVSLYNYMNI